jgi:hypothetical protein
MNIDLIYTNPDHKNNWFYNRYFYGGTNLRYYTFQLALNLLYQGKENPIIIETGCQREEDDVGAGMSTSIFAEYVHRYGGKLITVDNNPRHLSRARTYCQQWVPLDGKVEFVCSDSVGYLRNYMGEVDLIYLDSLDYPVGRDEGNVAMQQAAQWHSLNELTAIEPNLHGKSIILLDDNHFAGGGKPAKAKEYLVNTGWICLLDLQSTLWIRRP